MSLANLLISFESFCYFFVDVNLLQSTRFHFDGERVKGSDTAAGLGMVEGDTIEAFLVNELF